MDDDRPERDLARAAITAQNVNLITAVGSIVGVVLAIVAWWFLAWPRANDDPLLVFVLFLVLPYVGLIAGSRIALMLLRG